MRSEGKAPARRVKNDGPWRVAIFFFFCGGSNAVTYGFFFSFFSVPLGIFHFFQFFDIFSSFLSVYVAGLGFPNGPTRFPSGPRLSP